MDTALTATVATRGVMTRGELRDAGVSPAAIEHAVASGRWRRLFRAVYALHAGPVGDDQRHAAALLYAGPGAPLDAATACRLLGMRAVAASPATCVVVPHRRQVASVDGLVVRRTHAPIVTVTVAGLRVVRTPDAVIAASRRLTQLGDVRALVAESVQTRRTTVAALRRSLAAGPRAGSALARRALAEVAAGVRSAPEAELYELAAAAGLPRPLLNCVLYDAGGARLAEPDAYWPEAGLAHETDSRAWHLSPDDWEQTMRRHARLAAAGVVVIHSSPARIRTDRAGLAAELRAAYRAGIRRGPAPGVRAEALRP